MVHRPFPEEELGDLFLTYEFEVVVYFSNYLTFHETMEGEAKKLRRVLQYCKGDRAIRILYLTGPEGMYDTVTGKTLLVCEAEELCRKYAVLHGIPIRRFSVRRLRMRRTRKAMRPLLGQMGYRIWISQAELGGAGNRQLCS